MNIKTFHKATDLKDAHTMLQASKDNVLLGGGTWLKMTSRQIENAIDLSALGLEKITETDEEIIIGAMTTLNQFKNHQAIKDIGDGILADAVSTILGDAFRNLATIGGSVAGRFAFSDVITSLLAFDVTLGFYPEHKMTLETFLSVRQDTGILTEIRIRKEQTRGFFYKVGQTSNDFSTINVAITRTKGKTNIVIGARPAIAARAVSAMAMLEGIPCPDDETITKVSEEAVRSLGFADNHQASKAYRESLAMTYVRRGLKEVYGHDC
ncbi:MAG: FAD binding domain-containing protein [Acholeplasmataceae bacterium]|nr:FAD binding domain-containing protein [Acholeplasmataceae bacterium]